MKAVDFQKVLDEQVQRIDEMLGAKASEYATDSDRLSNFKKAAALQSCTPVRALGGMMAKHSVSIFDMINDLDAGMDFPLEVWLEKITDHQNYLFLLLALLREKLIEQDITND